VLRIVGMGGQPSAVEDSEIESVRAVIHSGLLAEPWPYLEAGCRVLIVDGPLRTVQGIFLEAQRNHKLVISISLLQRAVAVEINRDWAVPVEPVSVKTVHPQFERPLSSRRIA
jgi:transcription antitermination factor NusG